MFRIWHILAWISMQSVYSRKVWMWKRNQLKLKICQFWKCEFFLKVFIMEIWKSKNFMLNCKIIYLRVMREGLSTFLLSWWDFQLNFSFARMPLEKKTKSYQTCRTLQNRTGIVFGFVFLSSLFTWSGTVLHWNMGHGKLFMNSFDILLKLLVRIFCYMGFRFFFDWLKVRLLLIQCILNCLIRFGSILLRPPPPPLFSCNVLLCVLVPVADSVPNILASGSKLRLVFRTRAGQAGETLLGEVQVPVEDELYITSPDEDEPQGDRGQPGCRKRSVFLITCI
jgi:hypothetical protein